MHAAAMTDPRWQAMNDATLAGGDTNAVAAMADAAPPGLTASATCSGVAVRRHAGTSVGPTPPALVLNDPTWSIEE